MENIKTDRLILRNPISSDKTLLLKLLSDHQIREFVPHIYNNNLEDIEMFISSYYSSDFEVDFCMIIEEQKSNDIVGILEGLVYSDGSTEISYAIKSSARGNGFMSEALKGFITYLYNETNINSIDFLIRLDNNSSVRVMEKLNIPLDKKLLKYFNYKLSLEKEPPW